MHRILIIGGQGSGKTTFAKALSEKTRLPLIHLDKLYWTDNWTPRSNAEFDSLVQIELEKPCWIIDGNMKRSLPYRLKYADTVIIFDFFRVKCIWGAFTRAIKNRGKSRDDMGCNCPEKIDFKFYKTIWNTNYRREMIEMAESEKHLQVIILKNRRQVKAFLKNKE